MSKIKILSFIVIAVYIFGCNTKIEKEEVLTNGEPVKMRSDWKDKIKSDPYFQDLVILQKEKREAIAYNEYGNVNWQLVKINLKTKPKSYQELQEMYKKAGMRNPELYIKRQMRTMYLLAQICKTFPEFKIISPKERTQLILSEMPVSIDVNKVLEVRKKSNISTAKN